MNRVAVSTQWRRLPHPLRWVGVAVAGSACVLVGLVLLVLPGPGIPLLIVGLLILATEFAWAESLLQRVKKNGTVLTSTVAGRLGWKRRSAR